MEIKKFKKITLRNGEEINVHSSDEQNGHLFLNRSLGMNELECKICTKSHKLVTLMEFQEPEIISQITIGKQEAVIISLGMILYKNGISKIHAINNNTMQLQSPLKTLP